MKKFLQELHRRPAHEKRRFSLNASAGIMAVIFLVWISTLGVRLASGLQQAANGDSNNNQFVASVAAAGNNLQNAFGQIQSGLEVVGGQLKAAATTTTSAETPPAPAPAATVLSGTPQSQSANSQSEENASAQSSAASEDYIQTIP